MIEEYLDAYRNRDDYTAKEIETQHDFFYQLFMRQGSSEYALMMLFTPELQAHVPLFRKDQGLRQREMVDLPVSIVIGEVDWVKDKIRNAGKECVKMRERVGNELQSKYYICPSAGHNM